MFKKDPKKTKTRRKEIFDQTYAINPIISSTKPFENNNLIHLPNYATFKHNCSNQRESTGHFLTYKKEKKTVFFQDFD